MSIYSPGFAGRCPQRLCAFQHNLFNMLTFFDPDFIGWDAAEEKGRSVIGYCSDYKAGMDAGRKIAEAEYHNWELKLLYWQKCV